MMIETRYENIPNQMLVNYFKFLVGRVFKILYMQEENNPDLTKYLEGLLRELTGNLDLIIAIRYDGDFLLLMNKIQYLTSDYSKHSIVRKEVFECVSIINKLQKRYNFE